MSMNLRHMGFNEALDAAKQRSGLTNEAIANRSSLSTAAVSQILQQVRRLHAIPRTPCSEKFATRSSGAPVQYGDGHKAVSVAIDLPASQRIKGIRRFVVPFCVRPDCA